MKIKILLLYIVCGFSLLSAQEINKEILDTTARDIDVQFMLNTGELSTDSGRLLTIDGMGLFYFDQGTLVSLDSISCPEISMCRLKYDFECEDILMCNDKLIVKSGPFIIQLDGNDTHIICKFDTSDFFLYEGNNDYFNIVLEESDGKWIWYTFTTSNQKLDCMTHMDEPITKIIDSGTHAYIVGINTIYLVGENGIEPCVECDRVIVDAVSTSMGLFVITDDALFLINGEDDATTIIEDEMFSLYNDGDVLYMVMASGDVYRLNF